MNRRHKVNLESARDTVLIALTCALLIWPGAGILRPAAAPPKINGKYDVTFAGDMSGKGKAIVTPIMVKIDATLVDDAGNKVVFSANKLNMDGSTYRFRGTATVQGVAATVAGRLDSSDKTLKECRIVASYLTTDGKVGRIAGAKSAEPGGSDADGGGDDDDDD